MKVHTLDSSSSASSRLTFSGTMSAVEAAASSDMIQRQGKEDFGERLEQNTALKGNVRGSGPPPSCRPFAAGGGTNFVTWTRRPGPQCPHLGRRAHLECCDTIRRLQRLAAQPFRSPSRPDHNNRPCLTLAHSAPWPSLRSDLRRQAHRLQPFPKPPTHPP